MSTSITVSPRANTLSLMPVLLIGYMWLYIHRPFEVWPWLGALQVERIYMFVTLAYWLAVADKSWVRNRLNVAFGCFFLVLVLTWILNPYQDAGAKVVEDYAKIGVFYILIMSCIHDERNLRLLVAAFLVCITLYMTHSLREYFNGRHDYQMGTVRMIGVDATLSDPNSFAASLIYALPLTLPFWHTPRSVNKIVVLVAYSVLTTTCILLTGSRGGFVGLLTVGSIFVAMSRYRLRVALCLAVLVPIAWSLLPQDRQDRYMTLLDPDHAGGHGKMSAESRLEFFNMAIDLWQKNPVLGHGPGSFPLASGTGMEVHSLYGQLFAEVGLMGMMAFSGILVCYLLNVRDVARCYAGVPWRARGFFFWLSIAVLISVLLHLVLGLAAFNLYRYTWLWFGAFQAIALHCVEKECRAIDSNGVGCAPPFDFCEASQVPLF